MLALAPVNSGVMCYVFCDIKTLGGTSSLLFRLSLLSILVIGLAACEIDTRVSISDHNNPPTFKLSGNGNLILFIVVGPYSNLKDLEANKTGIHAIWEISPGEDSRKTVDDLPEIIYGKVPLGFKQRTPAFGSPPPLEEGKFYSIGAPSAGAHHSGLCFKVEQGSLSELSCRER